jgi:hypothetical protein
VTRSNAFDVPVVSKRADDAADFGLLGQDEMQSAEYAQNSVRNGTRGLKYFLDAGMGAPGDEN